PAWHDAIARRIDRGGQAGAIAAIQPDCVAQLGRADLTVALAVRPVADGTIVRKNRRTARRRRTRLFLPADDTNMADDIGDRFRIENSVAPECGHQAGPRRLMVGVPYAMLDRIGDAGEVAAPQPVIVGQAGIEFRHASPARAVTLDAVH